MSLPHGANRGRPHYLLTDREIPSINMSCYHFPFQTLQQNHVVHYCKPGICTLSSSCSVMLGTSASQCPLIQTPINKWLVWPNFQKTGAYLALTKYPVCLHKYTFAPTYVWWQQCRYLLFGLAFIRSFRFILNTYKIFFFLLICLAGLFVFK